MQFDDPPAPAALRPRRLQLMPALFVVLAAAVLAGLVALLVLVG